MPRLSTVLFVALLAVGCDDDRELREWTPEDHAHPAEADPSRMPAEQPQPGADLPDGTTEERAAAALWLMSCAKCHGREGRGDGPEAPEGVEVADLTTAELQESRTDEELAQAIAEGKGEMEAFGDRINERGIAALVRHIRRLGAPEGGATEATEGPGGADTGGADTASEQPPPASP